MAGRQSLHSEFPASNGCCQYHGRIACPRPLPTCCFKVHLQLTMSTHDDVSQYETPEPLKVVERLFVTDESPLESYRVKQKIIFKALVCSFEASTGQT